MPFVGRGPHPEFPPRRAEQRVSVSSLSQRLRDLEERLGVRLMNRTTRSVGADRGRRIAAGRASGRRCRDVGAALDQVRGLRDVPSGRLRINAPPPAIDLVLAPMVAPFLGPIRRSIWRSCQRQLVRRHRRRRLRRRRALWRAPGAGHDRGLARSAAALCGGGVAGICCAAWAAETSEGSARSRPASASGSAAA